MALPGLEIRRRIFHLVCGVIIVGLINYDFLDSKIAAILLVLLVVLGIIIKKVKVPVAYWFFKKFDRPKDFKKMPGKGAIFYLVGVILVLTIFPKDIAMASILILALGDSIAPIVGQYGSIESPWNKKKYIEGSIAGAVIGGIGAMLFVGPLEAVLAAIAAMIAEGVGLKIGVNPLDDNIVMPIVAGAVMLLLRFLI